MSSSFEDMLTRTVRSTPEFADSPTLAVNVAQTGDPLNGQAVAHTAKQQALTAAYDDAAVAHGGHHVIGSAFHWLGGAVHEVLSDTGHLVGKGLHLLNAPLAEVQHQYRYLHDVESRHGPMAALLEGLGIAGGAAVGALADQPVLGAELVAGLEGRLTFRDSWKRTQDGDKYRDPTTQRPVSIGRDVASVFGLKAKSKPYGIVSGLGDFISDIALDPFQHGLEAIHAPASAEGLRLGSQGLQDTLAGKSLTGKLLNKIPGLADAASAFPARRYGGTLVDPLLLDDIPRVVREVPSVKRMMENVAQLDSGGISHLYPTLRPIADKLGSASTFEQVQSIFQDQAEINQILDRRLPTLTVSKEIRNAVATKIGNYEGPLSGGVRRATSFIPYVVDTKGRIAHEIDPGSHTGFKAVYDTFRFAHTRDVAEAMTTRYINAPPAERILIYREGILRTIGKLTDDPEILQRVQKALEEATGGIGAGTEDIFGFGPDAQDLSKILTDKGLGSTAAIWQNQAGKMAIPDWGTVNQNLRSLNRAKKFYGAADEWVYHHFTSPIFKPLALATGGFALRMATAEALPEVLRHGFGEYVQNLVAARAGKLGMKVEAAAGVKAVGERLAEEAAVQGKTITQAEIPHIGATMSYMLGGPRELLQKARANSPLVELTADLTLRHDLHVLSPAVNATHGMTEILSDESEKAANAIYAAGQKTPMVGGKDFEGVAAGKKRMPKVWQSALMEPSRDPIGRAIAQAHLAGTDPVAAARAVIDGLPAEQLELMQRHFWGSAQGVDPHADWAEVANKAFQGLVTGKDGTIHTPLIEAIAENRTVDRRILDAIPIESRPEMVKGRVLIPRIGGNVVFDKIFSGLGGFINAVAREPMYVGEVHRQMGVLQGLVDAGMMQRNEALDLAEQRAINQMMPFIHNPAERTQLAVNARNIAPFFFAQQQAYARFGRLLDEDPAAFRKMQLLVTGLVNAGHETKDGQGNPFLHYPGAGFVTNGTAGLLKKIGIPLVGSVPLSMTGDIRSLNTVIPFGEGVRVGFGPAVAIPMRIITNVFPEAEPLMHDVLGEQAASRSIWQQLMPSSTVYRTIQALGNEHKRSFASSMMQTIQVLAYQQEQAMAKWTKAGNDPNSPDAPHIIPPANAGPIVQQAFIDKVKNQTRVNFLAKAVFGLVAPASPSIDIGDVALPQELRDAIKKDGLSIGTGKFLEANPNATPYTVFQSKNQAGAPLPATRQAQDFYDRHRDFLSKYPYAGAWLLPQTGEFNQGVYNEQLAQHLRIKKAPDQFLKDIYTASGNHQFFEVDKSAFDKRLAELKARGDKEGAKRERANFNAYLSQQGLSNPVWWDDFQSADRDEARKLAINDLTGMVNDPALPHSPMGDGIRGLLSDYQTFQSSLVHGRTDTDATALNKAHKQNFQAYLAQLAQSEPVLKPMIRKVFLDLSQADPTAKTAIQQVFAV